MPIIQPAEIWQATGRWNVYGEEMFKLKDRHGRDYCLAPTHEEMVTTLIQMDTNSYKSFRYPFTRFRISTEMKNVPVSVL